MIVDSFIYIRSCTQVELFNGWRIQNIDAMDHYDDSFLGCKFVACPKYEKGASSEAPFVIWLPGQDSNLQPTG